MNRLPPGSNRTDTPVPDPTLFRSRSGTATSVNDGTLSLEPAGTRAAQPYVALPTLPTATDPHTVSTVGVFNDRSALTDSTLFEPLGLSYTTAPLASDVVSAGPASLEQIGRAHV